MSLIDCRVGRKTVEETLSLGVPKIDSFAAAQYDRKGMVVVGSVLVFQLHSFC